MNLSEVTALIYGEEKEEILTATKTVKRGMSKMLLCYTFIMVV